MKTFLCFIGALLLASCKGGSDTESRNGSESSSDREGVTKSDRKNQPSDIVIIETSMGTIRAKLHPNSAPITVENFLSYVDKGHYDETIFHRVMSNFMIQGGGFKMTDGFPKELKTGSGITNESADSQKNTRGTLAMARTNDPNSATAQFFINVKNNPNLDHPNMGGYAVFGEVIEGMDVVDAIKEVETGQKIALSLGANDRYETGEFSDVPVELVTIQSIKRAPKSE
ncbi:MAG: peptidylprolyl isomerase [Akkermansiaceae bacterium]|jgi:cyclophilin family peptidyl-prolyl cis-trans isomerase